MRSITGAFLVHYETVYLARSLGNRRSGYCWKSTACYAVFVLGLEWLVNGRREIREHRQI